MSVATRRRKRDLKDPSLAFLGAAHRAVKTHLRATTDLPTFLESAGVLSLNGRKRLVDQALVLMEQNYVHLPLKEAMHGVDPVQRLRLVKHRLGQATTSTIIDGRLIESRDAEEDGTLTITVALPDGAEELRVAGFENGDLVAVRKVSL